MRILFATVAVLWAGGLTMAEERLTDSEKLQGAWEIVSIEKDGKQLSADEIKALGVKLLVFRGQRAFGSPKGSLPSGTFELSSSKTPHLIIFRYETGELAMNSGLGIYELSGDDLRICVAEPARNWPTGFATREDDGMTLTTYRRMKLVRER